MAMLDAFFRKPMPSGLLLLAKAAVDEKVALFGLRLSFYLIGQQGSDGYGLDGGPARYCTSMTRRGSPAMVLVRPVRVEPSAWRCRFAPCLVSCRQAQAWGKGRRRAVAAGMVRLAPGQAELLAADNPCPWAARLWAANILGAALCSIICVCAVPERCGGGRGTALR